MLRELDEISKEYYDSLKLLKQDGNIKSSNLHIKFGIEKLIPQTFISISDL